MKTILRQYWPVVFAGTGLALAVTAGLVLTVQAESAEIKGSLALPKSARHDIAILLPRPAFDPAGPQNKCQVDPATAPVRELSGAFAPPTVVEIADNELVPEAEGFKELLLAAAPSFPSATIFDLRDMAAHALGEIGRRSRKGSAALTLLLREPAEEGDTELPPRPRCKSLLRQRNDSQVIPDY